VVSTSTMTLREGMRLLETRLWTRHSLLSEH